MNSLPIGTILTVPASTTPCNQWIEYVDNLQINLLYPNLYKVLKQEVLPAIINKVPAGAIQFSISSDSYGTWKLWGDVFPLRNYPELLDVIKKIINNPYLTEDQKSFWGSAIHAGMLPNIENMFFSGTNLPNGSMFAKGVNGESSHFYYPAIEHTEDILKPLGKSSVEPPKTLFNTVIGKDIQETDIPANFVLLGQRPSIHLLEKPAMLLKENHFEYVGFPDSLKVNILINTETYCPNIPKSHKLIIKVC